jgi:hypothetical protein
VQRLLLFRESSHDKSIAKNESRHDLAEAASGRPHEWDAFPVQVGDFQTKLALLSFQLPWTKPRREEVNSPTPLESLLGSAGRSAVRLNASQVAESQPGLSEKASDLTIFPQLLSGR